jgi:fatty acid desaturase
VEIKAGELETLREEIRRSQRRRDLVSVGSAIFFAGLLWTGMTGGQNWAAWACAAIGAGWLLAAWRRN